MVVALPPLGVYVNVLSENLSPQTCLLPLGIFHVDADAVVVEAIGLRRLVVAEFPDIEIPHVPDAFEPSDAANVFEAVGNV